MQRILVGRQATLTLTVLVGPETPGTADDGTDVTVAVANDAGEDVTPTVAIADPVDGAPGVYELNVGPTDATADLDRLTATWTVVLDGTATTWTTHAEVVGGHHFDVGQIRHPQATHVLDEDKFGTELLEQARTWWEDLAEDYCQIAFVPRYRRTHAAVTGRGRVAVGIPEIRTIRSCTVNGRTVDPDGWLIDPAGYLRPRRGQIDRDALVEVAVTHGLDHPPAQLVAAGLVAARDWAEQHRVSWDRRRVYAETDEMGTTVRYARPGVLYPTGIAFVDRALDAAAGNRLPIGRLA